MLSVDYFVERSKELTLQELIQSVQQDALVSCRIIAMQKWRLNNNGQWRAACLSIVKQIKVLEGEQERPEGEEE